MSVHEQVPRLGEPTSTDNEQPSEPDKEDFHELADDEFTLEADEAAEPAAAKALPPLPPRAAAVRGLFAGSQPISAEELSTIELPPASVLSRVSELAGAELSARERLKRLVPQIRAREIYVQEVERALNAALGRVHGQAFRIAELQAELREALARTAPPHEATPRAAAVRGKTPRAAPKPKPKRKPEPDDLLKITGIGPRTAQQLQKLGVTFAVMAKWTAADVTRVAKRLATSPDRIQREGWIKQARALGKAPSKRKRG
jgi:predicted flap endonuclease-1-like 5' DNA nuclease